jgi:putative membrane protein
VPAVPLTDYAGWFVVSALMSYVLQRVLTSSEEADRWPLAFYLWTWASSTLALAAFLDLAAAATWGFVAMGTVALPLARSLSRSR